MILILMMTVNHQTFHEQRDTCYYVLIDSVIMEEVIYLIGKCPAENCRGKVKIQNNFSKNWECLANLSHLSFYVRYVIGKATFSPAKKNPNSKAYDNNLHSIIAFCENGKGYTGLESLCSLINLVPPINKNAYQKLLLCVENSCNETAELSMKTAAERMILLLKMIVQQMKMPTLTFMIVILMRLIDNEFISDTVCSSGGS